MRVVSSAGLFFLSGCGFGLVGVPDTGSVPYDTASPAVDERDSVPLVEATDLEGRHYAVEADALMIAEPPGLDALRQELLVKDVLVYVAGVSSTRLELAVALAAEDGRQDPCEPVEELPSADWSGNPAFSAGPGEMHASFGGGDAWFRSLTLSGVFDPDGGAWRGGSLSAELDTRELVQALGGVDDPCGLVEDLGGECHACTDGEPACFALRLEDIVAERASGSFELSPDCR